MSFIDDSAGLDGDSDKLAALLENPASNSDAEVPTKPAPRRTQERNTVAPTPQESAPEEASADEETEVEGDDDIAPPSSWDADAKEKWAKLPADVRQIITNREAERERAINSKLQETAELRKQAESENFQTQQLRQAYERNLNVLAKQMEANIPAEFRDIRSPADLQALAQRDPATAQRFMIWRDHASQILGELDQLEQQKFQHQQAAQNRLLESEAKALVEKWPEIADPAKGTAIKNEISALLKSFNFNDSEIAGISDHRILLFAKQFMEGQKALAALKSAEKKVQGKPLPKVVAPSKGTETGKPAGLSKVNLLRAAKSGDQDATAAALEKLLSQ